MSNAHQEEPPEEFYGGIIADPMGLGKTLTMIALVASDTLSLVPGWGFHMGNTSNQTLIIVPPPCRLKKFLVLLRIIRLIECLL